MEMTVNYQGPGRYRHYKGGEYDVIGLSIHEWAKEHEPGFDPNNLDQLYVVYRPVSPGSILENTRAEFWLRRLSNFNQHVEVTTHYYDDGEGTYEEEGGEAVPRFVKINAV